ncbi:MAG: LacI family DNA-binding transcriptional regulator, partial [Rhodothermales bacterium]
MQEQRSKVTIYDVAHHAGVAISTVSRVLNNSSDVSDQTRARVLKTIETLNFRPHRVAKKLAQRQTPSLAIAIPTFTTPFHNELLKGVRNHLHTHDCDLLLFDLGSTSPLERLLNMLKRGTVDGLLLVGVAVGNQLSQELNALRSPVVLVGHHHAHFDCLYWDNAQGSRAAVQHLIHRGHRRIGLIRSYSDSYFQLQRIEGYRQALEEAGLPYDETLVQSGTTEKHAGFSEEHGYEAMKLLLKRDPVTAIFASSDVQAIG